MNKILVFAEQRDGEVKKSSLEAISLAGKLANSSGAEFVTVLIGHDLSGIENDLAKYGAANIYKYTNDNLALYNSEGYTKVLADAVTQLGADVVFLAATAMGRDLAPHLGARLNAGVATDCVAVALEDGELKIIRPMYAGKVRTIIKLHSDIKIITIRPNVFIAEENPATANAQDNIVDTGDFKAIVQEIIKGAEEKLDVTKIFT